MGVDPCPLCGGFHPNRWDNLDERKKQSEKMRKHWSTPEFREKHKKGMKRTREKWSKSLSESLRKRWATKEYREKMTKIAKEVQNRPERRNLQSRKIKEKWSTPGHREKYVKTVSDPKWRKKHSERVKKTLNNPETKEKMSLSAKKRANTPEYIKKFTEFSRDLWANEETRIPLLKKIRAFHKTDEYRKNKSESQKKAFRNPEIIKNYIKGWRPPTKPQLKLFKMLSRYLSNLKMEYPVTTLNTTRFIDVAYSKLKIGFEYDGIYWHRDEEKDRKRDLELQKTGWKIYHFKGKKALKEKQIKTIIDSLNILPSNPVAIT